MNLWNLSAVHPVALGEERMAGHGNLNFESVNLPVSTPESIVRLSEGLRTPNFLGNALHVLRGRNTLHRRLIF